MRRAPRTLGPAALAALAFVTVFLAGPLALMLAETVLGAQGGLDLSGWRTALPTTTDWIQLGRSLALGATATGIAVLLGLAHAWVTFRTDLPGAAVLGPLGVAPLVVPPIFVAMAFTDLVEAAGFGVCALLLGVSYAPFVAVLAGRGLRAVDGRLFEAALLCRGRAAAEGLLLRAILPEVAAGALLAFVFVVGEHGVPEFLTVRGKTWLTYAEGIFARWNLRMEIGDQAAVSRATIAALPLVALCGAAILAALALHGRATVAADFRPLPRRRLGRARGLALLAPAVYLGLGLALPVGVMAAWAAGSTRAEGAMSLDRMARSFHDALTQAGGDLVYTAGVAVLAAALAVTIAAPLALHAARGARWIEALVSFAIAVPAILLALGMVKLFNRDLFGAFYQGPVMLACAYAARFLPFAVLPLAGWARRLPGELDEAARLCGRPAWARTRAITLPLLAPAMAAAAGLVFVLGLRELDMAVILPAGNDTVVRRLSNVVHYGGEETGGALALLLLLVSGLTPALAVLLTGRKPPSLT